MKVRAGPGRMNENQGRADKWVQELALTRCSMKIHKVMASVALAASLAGCGAVDLISSGLSYAKAVETDLKEATGVKPEVGFNWHNGSLQSVTVTFPRVYAGKPLGELADTVRAVVAKDFKQTPDTIVLAFELKK
jgi:hypothetical protein